MNVGLIDVDGHNFPNLALMKLSAYHKERGDSVEWYSPLLSGHKDIVYQAKVFTFTDDWEWVINADEVIKGGTGYYADGGDDLPPEIEHITPDYSIYGIQDTAYGYMTRGCPRGCEFCIVKDKEGRRSRKVADLAEFWDGQENIVLLDPNFFACREWRDLAQQLIDSGAYIDFSQGCDIRIMTEEMAGYIKAMKIKIIHFAWDRWKDRYVVPKKLKMFKEITGIDRRRCVVYVLTNYDTTIEQDLFRVSKLRDIGCDPYVMIYNKDKLPKDHVLRKLQRWVNARPIWGSVPTFEEYLRENTKG